ncbi:hypothetical protein K4F52_009770 [Lecanicillium sp. MT-2017a]|nr:hypothetical protein K4F52_009770 [Lecanicillium sp. MT-2017a]
MKFSALSIGLLALLTPLTAAWSKEDREIFRIRDEIAAFETDPATTFYDILGISASASQDDISKAYRKLTRSLHPDKVKQQLRAEKAKAKAAAGGGKKGTQVSKGPSSSEMKAAVKRASELQTRLSLIAGILKGPSRDRYDHFLANGFPLWKGTDYYYNRYRPGLGTVMFGLFLVGGGAIHYLALYMSWKRQREFVQRYVKFARDTAWGGNMGIPGIDVEPASTPMAEPDEDESAAPMAMNRKQRRMMEKEKSKDEGRPASKKNRKSRNASKNSSRDASVAPTGVRKRVVAENGKVLVVDSQGDVFLEEQDEEGNVNEYLLDPNELAQPTYKDTAVVRVPMWLFNMSVGRLLGNKAVDGDADDFDAAGNDSDAPQNTPSTDSAAEDYELVDKSTESLAKAKTSGSQQQGGKPNKRKNKKR